MEFVWLADGKADQIAVDSERKDGWTPDCLVQQASCARRVLFHGMGGLVAESTEFVKQVEKDGLRGDEAIWRQDRALNASRQPCVDVK